MTTPALHRTRDGRVLCTSHNKTGAPKWHTEGCDACREARAKGIVRPDISTAPPPRQRGRDTVRTGFVNWDRVRAAIAAAGSTPAADHPWRGSNRAAFEEAVARGRNGR